MDVGTTQFSSSRSPAQHMQFVTLQNLYRLRIFNKLEVSRLDSRLSLFIIISSYNTLSWCQMVVRNQIAFKTIRTPTATKEFEQGKLESKEDHLTAIKLHFTAQQVELIKGTKEFRTFW